MSQNKIIAGFIGAGGIARSHAYSLSNLRFYYDDVPDVELAVVCSAREESRRSFSAKYGFSESSDLEGFLSNDNIDTVFILGPNNVHYNHLEAVMGMKNVKRIYIEKPVCSVVEEEEAIRNLVASNPLKKIQVGFQYLFSPSVREAFEFWQTGIMGKPLHFSMHYYHGDYLRKEYRDKRKNRLTPAPEGGAMADLGSHAISMLLAFLGDRLLITGVLQGGHFDNVVTQSDLFSCLSLFDPVTKAVGTLSASRIASGTGDTLSFEFFCENGTIRYSSGTPDYFEYYLEETKIWSKQVTGSNYKPLTSFPSVHVPPGWLRSMVHAHYVFLTGNEQKSFIPGIDHGLAVQRLLSEAAEHFEEFRRSFH